MAINFPDSPTSGQVFTSGTSSWTYDGVKWSLNSNTTTTNDSMPVGSILWYSTTTTPTGWLPADGAAVSRTTYATLFALISTTYGVGDGSTTFNVPSVSATTGKYFIRYTTSVGTVTTTSLATSPVGTMLDWPVTSSYPTGFLRADGSAVSRTSYADLFALIGTTYGVGDGSTTFNLPNLVAAGSGSPVNIIKASLGGTVEPSTVAHASSHAAGGSDVVSIKQSQINDFVFTTEAARDAAITSPTKGMRAYITAPTIPTATGAVTIIPTSGIQTIYNGSHWVCITPVGAYTEATGTTIATAYSASLSGSPGVNPSVTLVTGTTALIMHSFVGLQSGVGHWGQQSVAVAAAAGGVGGGTLAASDNWSAYAQNFSAGATLSVSVSQIITGLTAGWNTFTLQYYSSASSQTATMLRRRLTVQGIA